MAASEVAICNSALIKLGVETITTLADNTRQAKIMNEQYAKRRDSLLISHPWNFSMRWLVLEAADAEDDTNHDNPDYSYRHAIPSGVMRVWSAEYADEDYEVMDGYIYSNNEEWKVKCIMKITDPTKFSAAFDEALALDIAADNCFVLVQSNSLKATFLQEMKQYLPAIRSYDAQENPGKMLEQDIFINSRK